MAKRTWIEREVPDQGRRRAIVTGTGSRMGLEAGRMLAEAHADVVLAVRDPGSGGRLSDPPVGACPRGDTGRVRRPVSRPARMAVDARIRRARG